MNIKIWNWLMVLVATLIFALAGCKHEIPFVEVIPTDPNPYVNPDPCDPDSVYFQNTILPLISSSCAQVGCHDVETHEEDIILDSYAHIMNSDIIDPFDPFNSDMIEAILETGEDMMPPAEDGGPLTQDQIDLIVEWIDQGALNNGCIADCDTNAVVTFAQIVYPIIENSCQGCHSGSTPEASISLTNYSEISAIAMNGELMNSLLGINGNSVMPQNTTGLPECQINQIQEWINNGSPND